MGDGQAVDTDTTTGLWMHPPAAPVTRVQDGARLNQVNQAGRLLPLLQSTLDASADATLIVDAQGRLAYANEPARRMFSLAAFPTGSPVEPDATLGLYHPDGRPIPPRELPFARALRSEAVVALPLLVNGPAGQRSVDCTASLLRDAQGATVGAFATFRVRADAGQTAAAEDRLLAPMEAKLKLTEVVLENAPLAIALLGGESLLVKWANDDFRQLLGERARARDVVGLPLVEAIPGAEASGLLNLLRRGCASGRPFAQPEYEHRGLSRGVAYWRWTAVPLPAPGGEPLELLLMVVDITEQTLARRRPTAKPVPTAAAPAAVPVRPVVASSQVLQALVDALSEGVILADRQGAILHVNQAALRYHGCQGAAAAPQRREQLEEGCPLLTADGEPLPADQSPLARALRGESFTGLEAQVRRADATGQIRLSYDGRPVYDSLGQLALALVTVREVAAPKEGKCLQDRCAELLSQQMRAPLTSVTSMADWLHHRLTEHQLERETSASARILESAQRLTALAQNLAEAAWLESGNDERRKAPVSLLQLVAAVARTSGAGPERPRIRLECPDWLPPVSVNPERVERTVATLLHRAARVSPPGSPIVVRLTQREGEAVVTVVDQGLPIPRERALVTFAGPRGGEIDGEQADLALAMYIARLTVESHGGRIWVDGAEQRGCALSFSLPALR